MATQASLSTQYAADGVVRTAQGFIGGGTYTAADVVLSLGFEPDYFMIWNATDRIKLEWFKGMNQGDYLQTLAAGTTTLETDDAFRVNENAAGVSTPGSVFIDVSVADAITDNDSTVWFARG